MKQSCCHQSVGEKHCGPLSMLLCLHPHNQLHQGMLTPDEQSRRCLRLTCLPWTACELLREPTQMPALAWECRMGSCLSNHELKWSSINFRLCPLLNWLVLTLDSKMAAPVSVCVTVVYKVTGSPGILFMWFPKFIPCSDGSWHLLMSTQFHSLRPGVFVLFVSLHFWYWLSPLPCFNGGFYVIHS